MTEAIVHVATAARPEVAWSGRTLTLRAEDLFGLQADGLLKRFLQRVFRVEEVEKVEINRQTATAKARCRPGRGDPTQLLERLALAIREVGEGPGTNSPKLIAAEPFRPRGAVYRHEDLIVSWEVVALGPGHLRLRRDELGDDPDFARRITERAGMLPGVLSARPSLATGDLHIRFDPSQTDVRTLLHQLEAAERDEAEQPTPTPPEPIGATEANLAAATVGEFVLEAVQPLAAAFAVGLTMPSVAEALRQLAIGRVGPPALHTAASAAALTTGRFFPGAVMGWMSRFWLRIGRDQLAEAGARLLGEPPAEPNRRFAPGRIVRVGPGERVPVDGRIVGGGALIDERTLRGVSGLSRKGPGGDALADSLVVAGAIEIEADDRGEHSRAAVLTHAARSAAAAATHRRFAELAVIPTLAVAGAAAWTSKVEKASAVMRPDYFSGPALMFPLANLVAAVRCVDRGLVIRDPETLRRLLDIDVWLIDDHPALERTELEIESIEADDPDGENQVLRHVEAAWGRLDDDRADALRSALEARGLTPLEEPRLSLDPELTARDGGRAAEVVEVPSDDRPVGSLSVRLDGEFAGLIRFRRSDRPIAAAGVRALRRAAGGAVAIGLVSRDPSERVVALAARLGVDFHEAGLSPGEMARLILAGRDRGLKIGLVAGNPTDEDDEPARAADLAVSLDASDLERLDQSPAAIISLQPRLARLAPLYGVARSHLGEIRSARNLILASNLFGVAGALLWNFSSVTVAILTNLGAWGVHLQASRLMRRLDEGLETSPRPIRAIRLDPAEADAAPVALRRIGALPREMGTMLMTVGALGVALPGLIGAPAVVAGGLVLWPKAFGRAETWFEKRFPKAHRESLRQINRYLDDLEHRYPGSLGADAT